MLHVTRTLLESWLLRGADAAVDGGGRHGGVILPDIAQFFASEATINLTAFQARGALGSTVEGWLRSIRRPLNSRRLQTAVSPLAVELSLCSIQSHCGD